MNPLLALSTLLPATAGLTITTYTADQDRLQVMVASTQVSAICPDCGTSSIHIHGHYLRHPTDLPWGGQRVKWGSGYAGFDVWSHPVLVILLGNAFRR